MEEDKYNGWTNWETWCINLWLTNDEGVDNRVHEIIKNNKNSETPNIDTEDELKEFVDELIESKYITDNISLHRVNWKETIDSFNEE